MNYRIFLFFLLLLSPLSGDKNVFADSHIRKESILRVLESKGNAVRKGDRQTIHFGLTRKPSAPVTIKFLSSHPQLGIIKKDEITIHPDRWDDHFFSKYGHAFNTTVRITAIADLDPSVDISNYKIITLPLESNDSNLDGIDPPDFSLSPVKLEASLTSGSDVEPHPLVFFPTIENTHTIDVTYSGFEFLQTTLENASEGIQSYITDATKNFNYRYFVLNWIPSLDSNTSVTNLVMRIDEKPHHTNKHTLSVELPISIKVVETIKLDTKFEDDFYWITDKTSNLNGFGIRFVNKQLANIEVYKVLPTAHELTTRYQKEKKEIWSDMFFVPSAKNRDYNNCWVGKNVQKEMNEIWVPVSILDSDIPKSNYQLSVFQIETIVGIRDTGSLAKASDHVIKSYKGADYLVFNQCNLKRETAITISGQ